MINDIIYKILNKFAQFYKGPTYKIDPALPLSSMLLNILERGTSLIRCIVYGVRLSPRKLIFIERSVVLKNKNKISFGKSVTLRRGVFIDGLSTDGVKVGDEVTIGPYTIIECTGVITNIGKGFSIGKKSGIGAFSYIGAAGGIEIGNNVIIGQRASFHSENHVFKNIDIPICEQGVTRKGIQIQNNCWIGANVVFLDGATVEEGCVIGAGAVVTGKIPFYSVAAGVPAKVIKKRSHNELL